MTQKGTIKGCRDNAMSQNICTPLSLTGLPNELLLLIESMLGRAGRIALGSANKRLRGLCLPSMFRTMKMAASDWNATNFFLCLPRSYVQYAKEINIYIYLGTREEASAIATTSASNFRMIIQHFRKYLLLDVENHPSVSLHIQRFRPKGMPPPREPLNNPHPKFGPYPKPAWYAYPAFDLAIVAPPGLMPVNETEVEFLEHLCDPTYWGDDICFALRRVDLPYFGRAIRQKLDGMEELSISSGHSMSTFYLNVLTKAPSIFLHTLNLKGNPRMRGIHIHKLLHLCRLSLKRLSLHHVNLSDRAWPDRCTALFLDSLELWDCFSGSRLEDVQTVIHYFAAAMIQRFVFSDTTRWPDNSRTGVSATVQTFELLAYVERWPFLRHFTVSIFPGTVRYTDNFFKVVEALKKSKVQVSLKWVGAKSLCPELQNPSIAIARESVQE
ncbi:hypothetical protein BT69DRAFT_1380862 [Atractiella rhizophila]|nr:hypothetical protein BT69DRAFT_1380862 [Atractiella rhizophila]